MAAGNVRRTQAGMPGGAYICARMKIIIPESVHLVRPGGRSRLRLVPAEGDALSQPPAGWRSRAGPGSGTGQRQGEHPAAMRNSAVSRTVTAIRCTTPLYGPGHPGREDHQGRGADQRENPHRITAPAERQHQRRREHRPVRDPADHIVHLVVPRFTGEPRVGQQHVIAPG